MKNGEGYTIEEAWDGQTRYSIWITVKKYFCGLRYKSNSCQSAER